MEGGTDPARAAGPTAWWPARRWGVDRSRLTDLVLGVGLAVFDVVTVLHRSPRPAVWGLALWGAQTVPLLWRRSRPRAVLAAMTGLYVAFQALSPIHGRIPGPFLLMLGVYALARYAPRRASLAGTVMCLVVALAADALTGHWEPPRLGSLEPISATTFVFFFALAWILGYGARRLRAEQELNARQAVLAERARIARDLHDVVAHHVSAIAVQARAVEDVLGDDPGPAAEGVALIAGTADTALVEMRRLLGLLSPGEGELVPEPSLDHVDRLVDAAAAAGCRVTYRSQVRTGASPSAGLRVSAYRIVQEALTNVVKHAGPVDVRVAVHGDDGARLVVEVDNDPPAPGRGSLPGAGRGLLGMRERVAAFDGLLEAGPRADGGWRVRAVLSAGPATGTDVPRPAEAGA